MEGVIESYSLPGQGEIDPSLSLIHICGYVWTSGPAIKPLALACVKMIKEAYPGLSVIASGGCAKAEDVIEFLLAGADAVQMLSLIHI